MLSSENKTRKEQVSRRRWRNADPCALPVGTEGRWPLWETVGRFLRELKLELPQDTVILLLSLYSKEPKGWDSSRHWHTTVPTSVLPHNRKVQAATVSTDGHVAEQNVVLATPGILFRLEEE